MIPLLSEPSDLSFCKIGKELTLLEIHWCLIDVRCMQNFNKTSFPSPSVLIRPGSWVSGAPSGPGNLGGKLSARRNTPP